MNRIIRKNIGNAKINKTSTFILLVGHIRSQKIVHGSKMEEISFLQCPDLSTFNKRDFTEKLRHLNADAENKTALFSEIRQILTQSGEHLCSEINQESKQELVNKFNQYMNLLFQNLAKFDVTYLINFFIVFSLMNYKFDIKLDLNRMMDLICTFIDKFINPSFATSSLLLPHIAEFICYIVDNKTPEFQNIDIAYISKLIPVIFAKYSYFCQYDEMLLNEQLVFILITMKILLMSLPYYSQIAYSLPYNNIFELLRNMQQTIEAKASANQTSLSIYLKGILLKTSIANFYFTAILHNVYSDFLDISHLFSVLFQYLKSISPLFVNQIVDLVGNLYYHLYHYLQRCEQSQLNGHMAQMSVNMNKNFIFNTKIIEIFLDEFPRLSNFLRLTPEILESYVRLYSFVFAQAIKNKLFLIPRQNDYIKFLFNISHYKKLTILQTINFTHLFILKIGLTPHFGHLMMYSIYFSIKDLISDLTKIHPNDIKKDENTIQELGQNIQYFRQLIQNTMSYIKFQFDQEKGRMLDLCFQHSFPYDTLNSQFVISIFKDSIFYINHYYRLSGQVTFDPVNFSFIDYYYTFSSVKKPDAYVDELYHNLSKVSKIIAFKESMDEMGKRLTSEIIANISDLPLSLIELIHDSYFDEYFDIELHHFVLSSLLENPRVFVTFLDSYISYISKFLRKGDKIEHMFMSCIKIFEQILQLPKKPPNLETQYAHYNPFILEKFNGLILICQDYLLSIEYCSIVLKFLRTCSELVDIFVSSTDAPFQLYFLSNNGFLDICRKLTLSHSLNDDALQFFSYAIQKNQQLLSQVYLVELLFIMIDSNVDKVIEIIKTILKQKKSLVYSHPCIHSFAIKAIQLLDKSTNIETKKVLLKLIKHSPSAINDEHKPLSLDILKLKTVNISNSKYRFEIKDIPNMLANVIFLIRNLNNDNDSYLFDLFASLISALFNSAGMSYENRKLIMIQLNQLFELNQEKNNQQLIKCINKIIQSNSGNISVYAHLFVSLFNIYTNPPMNLIKIILTPINSTELFTKLCNELCLILDFQLFQTKYVYENLVLVLIENIDLCYFDPIQFALLIHRILLFSPEEKSTHSDQPFLFSELDTLQPKSKSILLFARNLFNSFSGSLSPLLHILPFLQLHPIMILFEMLSKLTLNDELISFFDQAFSYSDLTIKFKLIGYFIHAFPSILDSKSDVIFNFVKEFTASFPKVKRHQDSILSLLNGLVNAILEKTQYQQLFSESVNIPKILQHSSQYFFSNIKILRQKSRNILLNIHTIYSSTPSIQNSIDELYSKSFFIYFSDISQFGNERYYDFTRSGQFLLTFYRIFPQKIFSGLHKYLKQLTTNLNRIEIQSVCVYSYRNSLSALINFLCDSNVLEFLSRHDDLINFSTDISILYVALFGFHKYFDRFFSEIQLHYKREFMQIVCQSFQSIGQMKFLVLYFENNKDSLNQMNSEKHLYFNEQINQIFESNQVKTSKLTEETNHEITILNSFKTLIRSYFGFSDENELQFGYLRVIHLYVTDMLHFEPFLLEKIGEQLIKLFPKSFVHCLPTIIQIGSPFITNHCYSVYMKHLDLITFDILVTTEMSKNEAVNEVFIDTFFTPFYIQNIDQRIPLLDYIDKSKSSYLISSFLIHLSELNLPIPYQPQPSDLLSRCRDEFSQLRTLLYWSKNVTEANFIPIFTQMMSFITINTSFEIIKCLKTIKVPDGCSVPTSFFSLFDLYRKQEVVFTALCEFMVNNTSHISIMPWSIIERLEIELDIIVTSSTQNSSSAYYHPSKIKKLSQFNDLLPLFKLLFWFIPDSPENVEPKILSIIHHCESYIRQILKKYLQNQTETNNQKVKHDFSRDVIKEMVITGFRICYLYGGKNRLMNDLCQFIDEVFQKEYRIEPILVSTLSEMGRVIAVMGSPEKFDLFYNIIELVNNKPFWPLGIYGFYTILKMAPRKILKRISPVLLIRSFPLLYLSKARTDLIPYIAQFCFSTEDIQTFCSNNQMEEVEVIEPTENGGQKDKNRKEKVSRIPSKPIAMTTTTKELDSYLKTVYFIMILNHLKGSKVIFSSILTELLKSADNEKLLNDYLAITLKVCSSALYTFSVISSHFGNFLNDLNEVLLLPNASNDIFRNVVIQNGPKSIYQYFSPETILKGLMTISKVFPNVIEILLKSTKADLFNDSILFTSMLTRDLSSFPSSEDLVEFIIKSDNTLFNYDILKSFLLLTQLDYKLIENGKPRSLEIYVKSDFGCLKNLRNWNYSILQDIPDFAESTIEVLPPLAIYLRRQMNNKALSLLPTEYVDNPRYKPNDRINREIIHLLNKDYQFEMIDETEALFESAAKFDNNTTIDSFTKIFSGILEVLLPKVDSSNLIYFQSLKSLYSVLKDFTNKNKELKLIELSPCTEPYLLEKYSKLLSNFMLILNRQSVDVVKLDLLRKNYELTKSILIDSTSLRETINQELIYHQKNSEKSIENLLVNIFSNGIMSIDENLIEGVSNAIEEGFKLNCSNDYFLIVLSSFYSQLKPRINSLFNLVNSIPFHLSKRFIELISQENELFKPLIPKIHPGFYIELVQKINSLDNVDLDSVKSYIKTLNAILSNPTAQEILAINQKESDIIKQFQTTNLEAITFDHKPSNLNNFISTFRTSIMPMPLSKLGERILLTTCYLQNNTDKFITTTFSLTNGDIRECLLIPLTLNENLALISILLTKIVRHWPETFSRGTVINGFFSITVNDHFKMINAHHVHPLYSMPIFHHNIIEKSNCENKNSAMIFNEWKTYHENGELFNFTNKQNYCDWFYHFGTNYSAISVLQCCLSFSVPLMTDIFINHKHASVIITNFNEKNKELAFPRMCGKMKSFCNHFVAFGPFRQGFHAVVDCCLQYRAKVSFLLGLLLHEEESSINEFFDSNLIKYSIRAVDDPHKTDLPQEEINNLLYRACSNTDKSIIPWL